MPDEIELLARIVAIPSVSGEEEGSKCSLGRSRTPPADRGGYVHELAEKRLHWVERLR